MEDSGGFYFATKARALIFVVMSKGTLQINNNVCSKCKGISLFVFTGDILATTK
jgi:hypothetical protein